MRHQNWKRFSLTGKGHPKEVRAFLINNKDNRTVHTGRSGQLWARNLLHFIGDLRSSAPFPLCLGIYLL